ncbi:DUF3291 domain-containing protein [Novosphingobium rosa]|uniref:DUF3291 domain-containing protein n=1 Tax=Novosphingobium rosa TaxID=76978 RepID=UPI001FE054AE|nr:DUF3291 domain-containing protein [Novosphingobium rosa]
MVHARRAIAQVQQADGFLAGAVRPDGHVTFWTISVWRDELAVQSYVASGAHRSAMPRLFDWAVEASVVRWRHDSDDLPDWAEAVERMRKAGRPSALRHPGPHHADMSFAEPQDVRGMRL